MVQLFVVFGVGYSLLEYNGYSLVPNCDGTDNGERNLMLAVPTVRHRHLVEDISAPGCANVGPFV